VFERGPGDVVLPALDEPGVAGERAVRRQSLAGSEFAEADRFGQAGVVGDDQADGSLLLWRRQLGELALVFLDCGGAGKLEAQRAGLYVGMLPSQRLGEHVGFPCREQVANGAQQRWFDEDCRCEQAKQFVG
jgi:hypothetical protein